MITVKSPARVALNKLYPASIYARPALAPLVVGVGGQTGKAQQQLTEMYKYTIKQMAVSPFAVNSEEYMNRIREEYGYEDNGMYDTMGIIGGVVGVGVGAYMRLGGWKGFINKNAVGKKPSTWFQNPFVNIFNKNESGRMIAKEQAKARINKIRIKDATNINEFIETNKPLTKAYNESVDNLNIAKKNLNKINNKINNIDDPTIKSLKLNKNYSDVIEKSYEEIKEIEDAISKATTESEKLSLQKQLTSSKDNLEVILKKADVEYDDFVKAYDNVQTATKTFTSNVDEITQVAIKMADTADNTADAVRAANIITDTAKAGKVLTKASKIAPVVGVVGDAASAAINVAGAVQAFQDEQYLAGTMYTLSAALDVASIAVEFLPGVGTLVGMGVSALSMATGAFADWLLGSTIGHSLTSEGAKAQQLFAENLYGSIANRPLTSVATVLSTFAVPALVNASARIPKTNWATTALGAPGRFFAHNPFGNYMRSAVTMGVTQAVNSLTTKVEDEWRPPQNAEDVNFVTAFSVVGDLNDNLFGATQQKAALLGLVKGDPKAQTNALARAWGYSNEDIYYNPTFDDIREAAGIDLGNIGNSIVGIVGEIFIDPQNRVEAAERLTKEHVTKESARSAASVINLARAKTLAGEVPNKIIDDILFKKSETGEYLREIHVDKITGKYIPTSDSIDKTKYDTILVYRDSDGNYKNIDTDEVLIKDTIEPVFNESQIAVTKFGKYSEHDLRVALNAYIHAWLEDGRRGLQRIHIENTAARGSTTIAIVKNEALFIDNLDKFLSEHFQTNKYNIEMDSVFKQLQNPDAAELNKKKFAQLYKYYGVKDTDTVALIARLEKDLGVTVHQDHLYKLYQTSKYFFNQMDLISSATGAINKIANPILWVKPVTMKTISEVWNMLRNVTDTKHRAQMSISCKEAVEKNSTNITQEEVNTAKTDLENKSKKFKTEILKDQVIESSDETMKDLQKRHERMEQIKQKDKEYLDKELKEYRTIQELRIYDKHTSNTYIDISSKSLKDIENEIITLKNKQRTKEESARLKFLEDAYFQYTTCQDIHKLKIETITQAGIIRTLLDTMLVSSTEYTLAILQKFNKFKTLSTAGKEKLKEELKGLDKMFAILDSEHTGNKPFYINHENPNDVLIAVEQDLAEYICSFFNRYLIGHYTKTNIDLFTIKEVFIVKEIIKKNTFKNWNNLSDAKKTKLLSQIALSLCEVVDTDKAEALMYLKDAIEKDAKEVLKAIATDLEEAKENTIKIYTPLLDVDDDYIKRAVINYLMKHNPEYRSCMEQLVRSLEDTKKLIESLDNIKDENGNVIDISLEMKNFLKTRLNEDLMRTIRTHPMFSLIQEYLYDNIPERTVFVESIYNTDLYKTHLSKDELKYLQHKDTPLDKIIDAQQKIARTELAPPVIEAVTSIKEHRAISENITEENITEEKAKEYLQEESNVQHTTSPQVDNVRTRLDTLDTVDTPQKLTILKDASLELKSKGVDTSEIENKIKEVEQKLNNTSDPNTYTLETFENGEQVVYFKVKENEFARPIVYLNINGESFPFYCSTGANPKDGVIPGKWYPFFGIYVGKGPGDEAAWLNKGRDHEMASYYNSKAWKAGAEYLDNHLGDIRDKNKPNTATANDISKINTGLTVFRSTYLSADTDGSKSLEVSNVRKAQRERTRGLLKQSTSTPVDVSNDINIIKQDIEKATPKPTAKPAKLATPKETVQTTEPNKVNELTNNLRKHARDKYHIDDTRSNQTISTSYELKGNKEEAICKLGLNHKDSIDEANGHTIINIAPTMFVDRETGSHYVFSQLFDDVEYTDKKGNVVSVAGVKTLKYYKTLVHKSVKNIINLVIKGKITVIYNGRTYDMNNIHNIENALIDKYMSAGKKSKGITIKYNGNSDYYRLLMAKEIQKTIKLNIRDGKLYLNDSKFIELNGLTNAEKILEYLLTLDLTDEDLSKFLNNAYDRATKYVDTQLEYDKGLAINKDLLPIIDELQTFETKTVQSRYPNVPVVASDYIKHTLYHSDNTYEMLQDFADMKKGTPASRTLFCMLLDSMPHLITEVRKNASKINVAEFTNVYIQDGEYMFTRPNGYDISLTDLILSYNISKTQLDILLNRVLKNVSNDVNANYRVQIQSRYTNIMNMIVAPVPEKDFINMIRSKHGKEELTDEQIKDIYNKFYNSPKAYETTLQLKYNPKDKSLMNVKDPKQVYPPEVVELYQKFLKAKNRILNFKTVYPNGSDFVKDNDTKQFLIYVLHYCKDTKLKEYLLNNVFFNDYKIAKGIFSETHKNELKEELKELKINKEKYPNNSYYKYKIQQIEFELKFIENHQMPGDSKEEWINKLLQNKVGYEEVIRAYSNTVSPANNPDYTYIEIGDNKVEWVPTKVAKVFKDAGGKEHHFYIITRFEDTLLSKSPEEVVDKEITHVRLGKERYVLCVVDKPVDNYTEYKTNIQNKYKDTIKPSFDHIYIISKEEYTKIQDMMKSGEIDTISRVSTELKDIDAEVKDRPVVEHRLNVESYKVVADAYMHDLDLILKYGGDRERLYEFFTLFAKYPMLQTNYLPSKSLKNTDAFREICDDAEITVLFREFQKLFIDKEGNHLITASVLGKYFTDEYIKEGKEIPNDVDMNKLKEIKISNTTADVVLKNHIAKLHEQHKKSPFTVKISYDKVFNSKSMNYILQLKSILMSLMNQLKTTTEQMNVLRNVFIAKNDEYYHRVRKHHIEQDQNFNEDIFTKNDTGKIPETLDALESYYKQNKTDLHEKYLNYNAEKLQNLNRKQNKRFNYKAIYSVIKFLERNTTLFTVKNDEIVFEKDVKFILDNDKVIEFIKLLRDKKNYEYSTINKILYKEVVYPFIQNISLDFYKAHSNSFEVQSDIIANLGDPRYDAAFGDTYIYRTDVIYSLPQKITDFETIKDYINPSFINKNIKKKIENCIETHTKYSHFTDTKEYNNDLLSKILKIIVTSKTYKTQQRPDLFDKYDDRREYIRDTDYNKYTYAKDVGLKRTRYIVMDKGFDVYDQQNVITIAEAVAQNKKLPELEGVTDGVLHNIEDSLCDVFTTPISTQEAPAYIIAKQELDGLHIRTITDLNNHIIDEVIKILPKDYNNGDINSLLLSIIGLSRTANYAFYNQDLTTTFINQYEKELDSYKSKHKTDEKNLKKLFVQTQLITQKYIEHYKTLRYYEGRSLKKFNSVEHFVQSVNTDIYNSLDTFYSYIKNKDIFELPKTYNKNIQNAFYNSVTLNDFYRAIYKYIDDENMEQVYALIVYINHLKQEYKNTFKDIDSWDDAYTKQMCKYSSNVMKILKLLDLFGKGKDTSFNIFKELKDSTRDYEQVTKTTKAINKELMHVIGPRDAHIKSVSPVDIINQEKGLSIATRQLINKTTAPLFASREKQDRLRNDKSIYLDIQGRIKQELENEYVILMEEIYANSIDDCEQTGTYAEIRRLFSNVWKLLNVKGKDFIAIYQIATALDRIRNAPELGIAYINEFNLYVNETNSKQLNEEFIKINEHFKKPYLTDMNDSTIKAIVGFVLYNNYSTKTVETKKAELSKIYANKVSTEYKLSQSPNTKLKRILTSSANNKTRTEECLKIFYPEEYTTITEDDQRYKDLYYLVELTNISRLRKLTKDAYVHDTWAYVQQAVLNDSNWETYKKESNYMKQHRVLTNEKEKELARIDSELSAQRTVGLKTITINDIYVEDEIQIDEHTKVGTWKKVNTNLGNKIEELHKKEISIQNEFETNLNIIIEELMNTELGASYKKSYDNQRDAYFNNKISEIDKHKKDIIDKLCELKDKDGTTYFTKDFIQDYINTVIKRLTTKEVDIDVYDTKQNIIDSIESKTKKDKVEKYFEVIYQCTENILKQQNHRDKYKNNIELTQEYHNEIFKHFLYELYQLRSRNKGALNSKAKHDIKKGINTIVSKDFGDKLQHAYTRKLNYAASAVERVINNINKSYKLNYSTDITKAVDTLKDLEKEFAVLTQTKDELYEYQQNLRKSILERKPKNTKQIRPSIQTCINCIKQEWVESHTKAEDVLENIYLDAIANNKSIEYYLKDKDTLDADIIRYKFAQKQFKYYFGITKEYKYTIDTIKKYSEEHITISEYQKNLTNNGINEEEYKRVLKEKLDDELNSTYSGIFTEEATKHKFMFKVQNTSEYQQVQNKIKTITEMKEYNDQQISILERHDNLVRRRLELQEEIDSLNKSLGTLEIDLRESYDKLQGIVTNTSNSKLYRTYSKQSGIDMEESAIDIVNNVKERAIKDGIFTKEELDKIINNAGDSMLHNPIIDCLLTAYNYMYQVNMIDDKGNIKKGSKRFIVMDMETLQDITNEYIPYQVSTLEFIITDGKVKVHPTTVYYNLYIFLDFVGFDYTPENIHTLSNGAQRFIQQQKDIYMKDEPNITDYEVLDRVKQIVKKASNKKNNITLVKGMMEILSKRTCPIVAHNGMQFDFLNYDNFLENFARKTIQNEYFHMLFKDPESITKLDTLSILESNEIPDEELQKIKDELDALEKLHEEGKFTDESSVSRYKYCVDNLLDYLSKYTTRKHIAQSALTLGIQLNNPQYVEILEGGNKVFENLIDICYKFITTPDVTNIDEYLKNLKDDEIQQFDKSMIKQILEYLQNDIKKNGNYKSVMRTVQEQIREMYHLPKQILSDFDNDLRIEAIKRNIIEVSELIYNIKDLSDEGFKEAKQIIEDTKRKRNESNERVKEYTNRLNSLKTKLEELNIKNNKEYASLYETVQKIQEAIMYNSSRAHTALTKNLSKELEKLNGVNFIEKDIMLDNVKYIEKEIEDILGTIEAFINALSSTDSEEIKTKSGELKLKTAYLDNRMLNINSEATRKVVKENLEQRISEIDKLFDADTDTFLIGEDTFKDAWEVLKNCAQSNIDEIRKSLLNTVEYLIGVAPKEIAEILKKYKDGIINETQLRTLLNDLSKDCAKKIKEKNLLKAEIKGLQDVVNFIKQDNTMLNVTTKIASNSELMRNLDIIEASNMLVTNVDGTTQQYNPNYNATNVDILEVALRKERATISRTLLIIDSMDINKKKVLFKNVGSYLDNVVKGLGILDDEMKSIQTKIVERSVLGGKVGSVITAKDAETRKKQEEIFKEEAAKVLSKDDKLYEMYGPGLERVYEDLDKYNDIYAVTETYNEAVRYETKDYITVSFNTEYYHTLQKLVIPKNEDGSLKNIKYWKYEFAYSYNTIGHSVDKPKIHPKEFNYTDKFTVYGKKNGDLNRIIPYNVDDLIIGKKDYNKIAIDRLLDFGKSLNGKDIEYIRKNTIDVKDFDTQYLTKLNLSDIVRQKFKERLSLIHQTQGGISLINQEVLYRAIYKQVMGNLNAVKPGMYIMQIPKEHEPNIIQKMSPKGEKKLQIDIHNVSESNMGNGLAPKTMYTTNALFGISTSPVRTILTNKILRSKFTPIVINNDMFNRCDDPNNTSGDKVLEHYIYNPEKAEDLIKFTKWANAKLIKEYKDSKKYDYMDLDTYIEWVQSQNIENIFEPLESYIDKNKDQLQHFIKWYKKRFKDLKDIEQSRYDILIKPYEYESLEFRPIFTLRTGDEDLMRKYSEDIYHPMGINLTVAFTEDERAYEDVIVIDKKYANVFGIGEGNKIWIKYGFKGAVIYEEGVEETYGAAIVSKTSSLSSRGSNGIYMEMFSNAIADYCLLKDPSKVLTSKARNIFSKCKFITDLKTNFNFKNFEELDKWKLSKTLPMIYMVEGRIVLNPKVGEDFCNMLVNNQCDLYGNKTNAYKDSGEKIKGTYTYRDTIEATAEIHETYKIRNVVDNEVITKKYTNDNNRIYRGTMYVLMDPEHQASHMQSELKLQLTEDKGLSYVLKDAQGNVRKGGQQSFTVEESYAQKIGYNVAQYIVDAVDDTNLIAQYNATWQILLHGMEQFEVIKDDDGKILIERTVERIINSTKLSNSFKNSFREYYRALKNYNETKDENFRLRMEDAEHRIVTNVQKNWGSNRGIGYNKDYKKYNAARMQLVANTSHERGTMKMPADSFENLKKVNDNINGDWLIKKTISRETVNDLLTKYAETYTKEIIEDGKQSKYIIKLNKDGTLIIPKDVDANEYTIEIFKRLRYMGILDGYTVKGRTTTFVQGSEVTTYIDELIFDKPFKQTTAYVMAVRYPVQDTNATPVMKVTGIVEHSAAECSQSVYKVMGADNDGDAASFTMIKRDAIKGGLKYLDATTKEFYDENYLEDLHDDEFNNGNDPKDSVSLANPEMGTKAAYIGKKTSPSSSWSKIGDEWKQGKYKVIRKGNNHYTYMELLSYDPSIINTVKQKAKDWFNKYKKTLTKDDFNGCEQDDMFWINSHVWVYNRQNTPKNHNSKNPKTFYNNIDVLKNYYKKYEKEITELKYTEWWLNNTKDGNLFIEEHNEDLAKFATYVTLSRGRVSKLNVGVTGGYRKDIYLATTLSTFPHMNSDKTGKIWTNYGIQLVENEDKKMVLPSFTVKELFENIYKDKLNDLQQLSIEELYNLKNNFETLRGYIQQEYNNKDYEDNYDLKDVAIMTLEHYIETRLAEECLDSMIALFKHETPTYEMLYTLLEKDILLPPMTIIKEQIDKGLIDKSTTIPKPIMQLIKEYYVSRFVPNLNKLLKEPNAKELFLEGINKEQLLTRALSKELNDLIQEPISYSKHGAAIVNYTDIDEELRTNAEEFTEKHAFKKVFFGDSVQHKRAIAMGAEYNTPERTIYFEKSEELKNARSKSSLQNVQALDPNKGNLKKAIHSMLVNDVCGTFINNDKFEKFENHYINFAEFLLNSTRSLNKFNFSKLDTDEELLKNVSNAVTFFEEYNISPYRLIKSAYYIAEIYRTFKKRNSKLEMPYKNLLGLINLQGIDKDKIRSSVPVSASSKYKRFINYITEQDNPIDEEETGAFQLEYVDIEDMYKQEMENTNYSGNESDIEHLVFSDDTNENLLTDIVIKQLNINFDEGINLEDTLIQLISTVKVLIEQRNETIKDINNTSTTVSEIGNRIINDEIGPKRTEKTIKDASKTYTDIENTNRQIDLLEKEIKDLEYLLIKEEEAYNNESDILDSLHSKYQKQINTLIEEVSKNKLTNLNKVLDEIQKLNIDEINKYINNIKQGGNILDNLTNIKTIIDDNFNESKVVLTALENYKEEQEQTLEKSLKQNIKYSLLGNQDVIHTLLNRENPQMNIKPLSVDDIEAFQNSLIFQMDMYQHPFDRFIHSFSYTNKEGKFDIDWDAAYNYLVKHHNTIRITEVVKAKDYEGLARKLINYINVKDLQRYKTKKGKESSWDDLSKWEKRRRINKVLHKKLPKLETFEDLINHQKEIFELGEITLNGKHYSGIDGTVLKYNANNFITPTLKEIRVRSPKHLQKIWEEGILNNKLAIGFVYINDLMDATELAYKPYIVDGKGRYIMAALNATQKAVMRFSSGFLLRNAIDTFNQLLSDMYLQKGATYIASHPRQIAKYLMYGWHINKMYKLISEERLFTLSDIHFTYKQIERSNDQDDINKLSERLIRYLETYIKQGENLDNPSQRIKNGIIHAKELFKEYSSSTDKSKFICYKIFQFLGSIKFAEYYEFFDTKEIDGKPVLGLRIDATKKRKRNGKRIQRIKNKEDQLFKELLIEYSAFNQTNAMLDMFKEKQYRELYRAVELTKVNMLNSDELLTMEQIENEIDQLRKEAEGNLLRRISNKTTALYGEFTETTENLARILGFILHRDLYGESFNTSVQASLRNWFNYGQRSPLEIQLSYDIPYISFPLRSIDNWRSRLLDPRYARLMDDIIDGIYGQYADEDGQYSKYEQFMIKSGWIPIANKFGIRAGSGAFDVMNIFTDTTENINQRRNPILRGLAKFIETGDLAQSVKQLAVVGKLNQAAQFVTAGAYNASKDTWGDVSISKMFTTTFEYNDYEKYTPKQYSYLYNNNGRAKYYENIYRDWFTKYGRMRKPTQDPVQLVKGIQWKQFLRRMQNKYRR